MTSQPTEPATPIAVNESAAPAQAMSALRDLLKVAGAALVTKGMISQEWVEPIIGAILVIGPIVWTQLVTIWKHRQLVITADAAPARVSVVIRK